MNSNKIKWSEVYATVGDFGCNNSRGNQKASRIRRSSSTLATSCEELTHWKRLCCWEGLGVGGEGDDRG